MVAATLLAPNAHGAGAAAGAVAAQLTLPTLPCVNCAGSVTGTLAAPSFTAVSPTGAVVQAAGWSASFSAPMTYTESDGSHPNCYAGGTASADVVATGPAAGTVGGAVLQHVTFSGQVVWERSGPTVRVAGRGEFTFSGAGAEVVVPGEFDGTGPLVASVDPTRCPSGPLTTTAAAAATFTTA